MRFMCKYIFYLIEGFTIQDYENIPKVPASRITFVMILNEILNESLIFYIERNQIFNPIRCK